MRTDNVKPLKRLMAFSGITLTAIAVLYVVSRYVIHHIPSIAPLLFPTMTIFLMVFHIMIAVFMVMKYLCDKRRLYLMPIAGAFGGSALLMVGTLSSYSDWLLCTPLSRINYNDALIYYVFRNLLMVILFISAVILYAVRRRNIHHFKTHFTILLSIFSLTLLMLAMSWLYSSHYGGMNVRFVDNLTYLFTPLWQHTICVMMIVLWGIALILMLAITRLRNIFWFSGCFFCAFYIFTLMLLLSSDSTGGFSWYQARLFETIATLFLIFVLLCDVFTLYRESNSKYHDSYENSIRDPLTRLYNRSFFYDGLTAALKLASPTQPVTVIVSDLDHFKRINDNYGHLQGDKVIQFVSSVLQNAVRGEDVAARIGGEEFALMLGNTSEMNAWAVAERIRLTISEHTAQSSGNALPEQVTISMGVFTTTSWLSAETCVQRADEAMYRAKQTGRNRVVIWREEA